MEKINELMNAFIEWKGLTNDVDLYIIFGICIIGFLLGVKLIIDYYQDVVFPTSYDGFVKYVHVNKNGRQLIQVKVLIHDYLFIRTYYTFNLGAVYDSENEAEKHFLTDDSFIDYNDDFITNRIFKLRLLKQIENGLI